jgi:hypothetical protein
MMNEIQVKLWKRMIRLIGDYGHGKLPFHRLVDQLEGALDTADLKDPGLVERWYGHWTPLDEVDHDSAYDLEIDHGKVQPALEAMRVFLTEELREWERTGRAPHPRPHPAR